MMVWFLCRDGGISWSRLLRGNCCSLEASAGKEIKVATLAIFGSSI